MLITVDSIRRDLAAFALGGAFPDVTTSSEDCYEFSWVSRRGTPRITCMEVHDDEWFVSTEGAKLPYIRYLASDEIADLDVLARRTLDRVPSTAGYIDVEIVVEGEHNDGKMEKGVPRLVEILSATSTQAGSTQVLFLRGAAGAGKSAMLREISRTLAKRWLSGERSGPLALYVDAQAKALLSLDEAFASVLDDLDVLSIRKDAVIVLCRHGLIIPCIDGFDELLGAGGFGDAFNSLSGFISRLGGLGMIVASGRSTFYDQEQLQVTAHRYSDADYRTTTISVQPWSTDTIRAFFASRWEQNTDITQLMANLSRLLKNSAIAQLLGKPFFSAQLAQQEISVSNFNERKPVVAQLVEELVEREARKWVDLNKEQVLTSAQHRGLLKDVSLEMWWENSQEIGIESLKVLVEFFVQDLPLDHRPIVMGKAPTHSMFESGSSGHHHRKVRFQHSIYHDFFFCEKFIEIVERSDAISLLPLLNRGVFGEAMLDTLAQFSKEWNVSRSRTFLENIGSALRPDGRYLPARLNAGAIAATLLSHRQDPLQTLMLTNFSFQKVSLVSTRIVDGNFNNCIFEDVLMHGLVLENCVFTGCTMRRARIGRQTRFACDVLKGCEVISLSDDDGDGYSAAPDKIADILRQHGVPQAATPIRKLSRVQSERRDVLERLLRKLDRQYFFDEELEIKWGLNIREEWAALKRALLRTGVAAARNVERKGPNGTLITLNFTPNQIRDGESLTPTTPQALRDLWTYIG